MISNRTGLKSNKILNETRNPLYNSRGLKEIEFTKIIKNEIKNDDNNVLNKNELNNNFSLTPNTKHKLNKVYDKFQDLYNNNIVKFNDHFKDLQFYSNRKLENEDILNDIRDRKYWRNTNNIGSKRPDRVQYKNEINESILK